MPQQIQMYTVRYITSRMKTARTCTILMVTRKMRLSPADRLQLYLVPSLSEQENSIHSFLYHSSMNYSTKIRQIKLINRSFCFDYYQRLLKIGRLLRLKYWEICSMKYQLYKVVRKIYASLVTTLVFKQPLYTQVLMHVFHTTSKRNSSLKSRC